jgi:predicted nucleic acid-binding Zn finger protein
MRWNTFEQFKKREFSVWNVSLVAKSETWRAGTCTCPNFLKKYMCKHLIGMAIRWKLAKPPPAAKNVPINE